MHSRFLRVASCKSSRVSLLAVGLGTVATGLLACGPFLPEQILLGRRVVLRTPVGEFGREVAALEGPNDAAPALPPGVERAVQPSQARKDWEDDSEEERPASQLDVETRELDEVLGRRGLSEDERKPLLDQYKTCRAAVETRAPSNRDGDADTAASFHEQANRARNAAAADPATPAASPARQTVPASLGSALPAEWVDYLQGADCFNEGDLNGARQAWERLLARPQAERLDRSTWAAFMLARMLEGGGSPGEAAARYQRVRELRAAGCRDTLNLAAASLGWEARLALENKDFSAAARLYYLQARAGTLDGDSLGIVANAALGKEGDETMLASARDPFLRRLITLYLACSREFSDPPEDPPAEAAATPAPTPDAAPAQTPAAQTADGSTRARSSKDWLGALKSAGVDNVHEAATIAWAAYQQGDYAQAAEWLKLAPADEPLARWLRAKLALRAGKTDEAAREFAQAVRAFPADPATGNEIDPATWRAGDGRRFRSQQFQMDLGIVQLSRGDCTQALASLLRSGFWTDAAYVAEQVLTVPELGRYVRDNYPTAPAPLKTRSGKSADEVSGNAQENAQAALADGINARSSADPTAFALRYLLARRLTRVGRYAEARGYYPAVLLPKFDEYVAARKLGEMTTAPKAKRADAYWQAAKVERWLGMELFGTEADPDWFVEEGAFQRDSYRDARVEHAATPPAGEQPTPSPPYVPPVGTAEKRRLAKVETQPFERYHYRYRAADLAWKAAALMPDQQEDTAKVLAAGGRWLESVDATKAADRFYIAVLRRCGKTDIGREADKSGKLPDISGENP